MGTKLKCVKTCGWIFYLKGNNLNIIRRGTASLIIASPPPYLKLMSDASGHSLQPLTWMDRACSRKTMVLMWIKKKKRVSVSYLNGRVVAEHFETNVTQRLALHPETEKGGQYGTPSLTAAKAYGCVWRHASTRT